MLTSCMADCFTYPVKSGPVILIRLPVAVIVTPVELFINKVSFGLVDLIFRPLVEMLPKLNIGPIVVRSPVAAKLRAHKAVTDMADKNNLFMGNLRNPAAWFLFQSILCPFWLSQYHAYLF